MLLRIVELLKLPGTGEGAREEPRGAKDIALDIARPEAPGPEVCGASLSRLVLKVVLAYGTDD